MEIFDIESAIESFNDLYMAVEDFMYHNNIRYRMRYLRKQFKAKRKNWNRS